MTSQYSYEVIDTKCNYCVAKCKTLKSARKAAERRNQEFGAHRFTVRPI